MPGISLPNITLQQVQQIKTCIVRYHLYKSLGERSIGIEYKFVVFRDNMSEERM